MINAAEGNVFHQVDTTQDFYADEGNHNKYIYSTDSLFNMEISYQTINSFTCAEIGILDVRHLITVFLKGLRTGVF